MSVAQRPVDLITGAAGGKSSAMLSVCGAKGISAGLHGPV